MFCTDLKQIQINSVFGAVRVPPTGGNVSFHAQFRGGSRATARLAAHSADARAGSHRVAAPPAGGHDLHFLFDTASLGGRNGFLVYKM